MSENRQAGSDPAADQKPDRKSAAATDPGGPGWRQVCPSGQLLDGGDGVVVERAAGEPRAFVVRHRGQVKAWLNRCSHVAVELDWLPGRFFDESGEHLLCSMHGAEYDAASGRCLAGPCLGRGGLEPVTVVEQKNVVWLWEG